MLPISTQTYTRVYIKYYLEIYTIFMAEIEMITLDINSLW